MKSGYGERVTVKVPELLLEVKFPEMVVEERWPLKAPEPSVVRASAEVRRDLR